MVLLRVFGGRDENEDNGEGQGKGPRSVLLIVPAESLEFVPNPDPGLREQF
jgi:hypothetical protein